MYVNKIVLVGIEVGVGVCNVGIIGVVVGEVCISVVGYIENIGKI